MEIKQDTTNKQQPEDDEITGELHTADREIEFNTDAGAERPSYESMHLMLEDLRAKSDDHHNQLLRVHAEMDNVRRRGERELEKARKYALENIMQELLSVKDSLEMGLSAAQEPMAVVAKICEGMELTDKMLSSVLTKFGVKEINPLKQPFNPEWHQAMSTQESDTQPANTVVMVFQKGYSLNDRLIRPARVVVSKLPSGE